MQLVVFSERTKKKPNKCFFCSAERTGKIQYLCFAVWVTAVVFLETMGIWFSALNSPDLLHQLSAENLFKLIFLIIEADKDDHGTFDRVDNSGILTKVFQVLLQRSNGIQHLSKKSNRPDF